MRPVIATTTISRFTEAVPKLHEQGKTSYVDMSEGLARSGIEKWTMDTGKLTVTYYDKAGNEMLAERVE